MPELPPFLRHYGRRSKAVSRGPGAVSESIGDLYAELDQFGWNSEWLRSPRGKWVVFQLDWYEKRCRRGSDW